MKSTVGQLERITQERVVQYFQHSLGYEYLGNLADCENNRNIETEILTNWLTKRGVSSSLITRALHKLGKDSALGEGRNLYDANKDTYSALRYGIKVSEGAGQNDQTVYLIDWKQPENNQFAIAEEVTIKGVNDKRPDIVLYVNGIALGVIELKRSSVSVGEGISQNLDNQRKNFIRNFFSTIQLVMAGNDSAGLRYGTIETPANHYYQWKQEADANYDQLLDYQIGQLCEKTRLLELIHDFTVFDKGIKKIPRHNQYYGVKAAQTYVQRDEGGIIWHTQGSGKSLTMVWFAKWLYENVTDARVVVITDRTDLDEQIEGVFQGVDEKIHRCKSGADLVGTLNETTPWLLCSLVHKFGRDGDEATEKDTDAFAEEVQSNLPTNFKAKGKCFVFVDECHRTQSGALHKAMKAILPEAIFIGFTGTPLLKADSQKSIEVFGGFIHTYKFDEAVADGVVLDLRYEARDIEQYVTNQTKVDQWFEAKTSALSDFARTQLKKKWGSMQKLMSSQSRLDQIVKDILFDMETKQRLNSGRGNAMLVCASVHQACKTYEQFQTTELAGKCAIITSYKPSPADIKGEETGEGLTEALSKYGIYRSMLANYFEIEEERAMYKVEEFETQVKERFKKQPGQMRLLIVVDKLLTGFDAPSATYLYIDKKMQDHGLFQAICRVNRLDDGKDYGYIVDYKDLFKSLEGAVQDYTSGAFDGYEEDDVKELLTNRLEKGREKLEELLEVVKALCEPVMEPRGDKEFIRYFCGDAANKDDLAASEQKRVNLYKNVGSLIRVYLDLASEMAEAGYTDTEAKQIKRDVDTYSKARDVVKIASGDHVDMKHYEPGMRKLLDMYVGAHDTQPLIQFDEMGVIEMLVKYGQAGIDNLEGAMGGNREAVAETIENNVRKVIIDEQPINPKYYEKMSELLDALITQRREDVLEYKEYLEQIKELAEQVTNPSGVSAASYPPTVDTNAKKALYDNLAQDENIVTRLDTVIRHTKESHWVGDRLKERKIKRALERELGDIKTIDIDTLMSLIKNQNEYH